LFILWLISFVKLEQKLGFANSRLHFRLPLEQNRFVIAVFLVSMFACVSYFLFQAIKLFIVLKTKNCPASICMLIELIGGNTNPGTPRSKDDH
jgi:hypothetical protein